MTTKTNTGVTTTVTTLARATKAAEDKGTTIPDILLHEVLIAMRAEAKAKASKDALINAMKSYMDSEGVDELETDEAKALRYEVANQGKFDREGLERDHPGIYSRYFTPGVGTHGAFKVTPRA